MVPFVSDPDCRRFKNDPNILNCWYNDISVLLRHFANVPDKLVESTIHYNLYPSSAVTGYHLWTECRVHLVDSRRGDSFAVEYLKIEIMVTSHVSTGSKQSWATGYARRVSSMAKELFSPKGSGPNPVLERKQKRRGKQENGNQRENKSEPRT